ncbi:hypothetical protein PEC331060_39110 [Pectobacterium carotovorum subsp. carotovorum]|nr:hypothetical protein PEC331060_39110 [Pectobacterium carotovorum subsp. carotovorum]
MAQTTSKAQDLNDRLNLLFVKSYREVFKKQTNRFGFFVKK